MRQRLTRGIAALGLIGVLVGSGIGVQQASAHNYTVANWYTCQYDVYVEAPRKTGIHIHRYSYSYNMPPNYCSA